VEVIHSSSRETENYTLQCLPRPVANTELRLTACGRSKLNQPRIYPHNLTAMKIQHQTIIKLKHWTVHDVSVLNTNNDM
jgi:hypothetical protein